MKNKEHQKGGFEREYNYGSSPDQLKLIKASEVNNLQVSRCGSSPTKLEKNRKYNTALIIPELTRFKPF